MKGDIVTELVRQWATEDPNMDTSALGIVVRIQLLGKLLRNHTARALAVHDLKHWEYDVLSLLRRQGEPYEMPATEMAKAVMLSTGAMTTRINGLESRGLLRRRQSKADGRSVLVRLTARGLRTANAAIGTRLNDADNALAGLSSKQAAALAKVLQQINQHISK